jgi:hypothetical protein
VPDERLPGVGYAWTVRVHAVGPDEARAYCRQSAFTVGAAASFRAEDQNPSGIELLLGALGADLANGLGALLRRRGIGVDGIEVRLTGTLENPLVHLGVVGEEGRPGLDRVEGTVYCGADAEAETIEQLWRVVKARSPLLSTLSRACTVSLTLRVE